MVMLTICSIGMKKENDRVGKRRRDLMSCILSIVICQFVATSSRSMYGIVFAHILISWGEPQQIIAEMLMQAP